jgi:hypothetical protein
MTDHRSDSKADITPIYVSRTYLTRHGAGPLGWEVHFDSDVLCGQKVVDTTNIPNPWQGSLRFAPLNIPELVDRINADYERNQDLCMFSRFTLLKPQIALTCLDQSSEVLAITRRAKHAVSPVKVKTEDISKIIEGDFGIKVAFKSYGVNTVIEN